MRVRSRSAVRIVVVGMLAAAGLLVSGPAWAQSDRTGLNHNDQIVLNGRLIVAKNQTVDSAAILNGPAEILGTVRDTLFVLNGDVQIWGTIGKDVVVVNGDLVIHGGAHVGGDVVTQSSPRIDSGATIGGHLRSLATRVDWQGIGLASRFVWWVAYTASTLFLGLLLLLVFPALDAAVVRAWGERAGQAVGWGVAVFFLLPVVAVLAFVTVVGIPLGLFLLLALALVYTVGYVAGAAVLGRLLLKAPTSRFLAFLLGWVILRAIGLIPVLGGFVWLVASLLGLGALTVAARRTAPAVGRAGPPIAPPPPPPPTATAPA